MAYRQGAGIALLLPLFLLAACGPQQGGKPPAFPPAQVSVQEVKLADLPVELEYVGQAAGYREVEVRARVAGILEKRNFEEGAVVQAGQSLFTIDPKPFEAVLARAEADVAAADARLDQARRNAARLKPLWEAKAVSQKDHDDAVSGEAIANADAKAARARLQEAKLNLQYARVEAPIGGIAGRAQRSEGSLVNGAEALLTTVTQMDPAYVVFGIPDADRLRLRRDAESGAIRMPKGGRFEVEVRLSDGSIHPRRGRLDFESVRVDTTTGTSEARATLPNGASILRPGQFLRVRLLGATRPQAIKVPQRAVLEGPQGKFVYVVNTESKAEPRPVQAAEWAGEDWVISGGLKPGERVITDGLMRIGPGAPVQIAAPAGGPDGAPAGAAKADPGAPAAKSGTKAAAH